MNKNIIFFIIGLILLLGVLSYIGIDKLAESVKDTKPIYLVAAFILNLLMFLVWNLKFKFLVDKIDKGKAAANFTSLFPIIMVGSFINATTPGAKTGGGPVKAYYLSKLLNIDKTTCMPIVIIDQLTNSGLFLILSIISVLLVFLFLDISGTISLVIEIFLLLISLIIVSGILTRKRVKRRLKSFGMNKFIGKLDKLLYKIYYFKLFKFIRKRFYTYQLFESYVIERVEKFIVGFEEVARDRRLIKMDLFLALSIWILIYLKTYILFLGFGYDVNFMVVVIVVTISLFISSVMIVPGGIGLVEMAMITLYAASGVDPGIAAAVSVLDRFIFYFFALGIGYLSLNWLNFRFRR